MSPHVRALIRLAFAWSAIAWAVVIPVAAYAAERAARSPTPVKLFALAAYGFGSVICHQRPERSFHLLSVSLPVCARCTGIYAGAAAMVGIALLGPMKKTSHRTARVSLMLAVVPGLSTLVYEWTTGHTPSNEIRAATGVFLGAVVGWVVMRLE